MNDSLDQLKIDKAPYSTLNTSSRKTVYLSIGSLLIIAAVAVPWFASKRTLQVNTVGVALTRPTSTITRLTASGYVVAQRKAAVASKTTGRLEWIGVEEGSSVAEGQVIARLENRDAAAVLDQAEAALNQSKASLEQVRAEHADALLTFNRQKDLANSGIVSRAEFDSAETRLKKAKAALTGAEASVATAQAARNGAQVALDYTLIKAPFNGVVLTKNADTGDIITPLGAAANAKAAVVTIADLSSLRVEVDVSESSLSLVAKDQPCEISLDALPQSRFRGKVHMVVPTADRSKASVMVKVGFTESDARILPEMSAKVAFLEREPTSLEKTARTTVPVSAIAERAGSKAVYRVEKGLVREIMVTTGERFGDQIEIRGLNPGDRIVNHPGEKIRDGVRVKTGDKQ